MNSKPILEETISIKETRHFCAPIIAQYQKSQQIQADDFEWVHLVYAVHENSPKVFYIRFTSNSKELPNNDFSSYLLLVNKASFNELLFLVTYYGFFKEKLT